MNVTIQSEKPDYSSCFCNHPVGEHKELAFIKVVEFRKAKLHFEYVLKFPFEVKAYGAYKYLGFDTFPEWLLDRLGMTEAQLLHFVEVMGLDIAELDKGDSTKGGEYEASEARIKEMMQASEARKAILNGIPGLEGRDDYETARAQLLAEVAERKRQESEYKSEQDRREQFGELAQQELRDIFKQLMKEGTLPKNRILIKVRHDQHGRYYVTIQSSVKRIYESKKNGGLCKYLDGTNQRVPLYGLYADSEMEFIEAAIWQYAEDRKMEILSLDIDGNYQTKRQMELE